MITGLWIAIIACLLVVLIQTLVLEKHRGLLRTREQCFGFHELRDRLQLLAVDKKIDVRSQSYQFLWNSINISIRNAGVMKLSELLRISQLLKREVESNTFKEVQEELRSHPAEVQALASEIFTSFAHMLVVNDDLTYWLFKGLGVLTRIANEAVVKCVKVIAKKLAPRRVEVVREANIYDRIGQRLVPSY